MMDEFKNNFQQFSVEAIREAHKFVEKSNGLYSTDDIPAFIAGYLQALAKVRGQ